VTLTVCTYLWEPVEGSRYSRYGPDDVRLLQRMVARNLSIPHDFVVVTDHPEAFADDSAIRVVPIDWTTHVSDTCFVRLFTFSPRARKIIGERVLQLDLDTVIVGDLGPIVDRSEDLVLWRNPRKWPLTFPEVGHAKRLSWFNGAVMLHSPGTWGVIWQNFDPHDPGARDDQWLISDYAGKDNPYWDQNDGIYRPASRYRPWQGIGDGKLPANARLVTFAGDCKPWLPEVIAENPWIQEFRR
jgi:hypothetical protein